MAQPVPEGYHTATPYLLFRDTRKAIAFYQRALGAKEKFVMSAPDGRSVAHAEMAVGDSILMMGDESQNQPDVRSPESLGATTAALYLYVNDCDALFEQATRAGASIRMPVTDMFWGDRVGQFQDPFGYIWYVATHKKDVTPQEMTEAIRTMAGAKQ